MKAPKQQKLGALHPLRGTFQKAIEIFSKHEKFRTSIKNIQEN